MPTKKTRLYKKDGYTRKAKSSSHQGSEPPEEVIQEMAAKVGKEGFATVREQYIYTRQPNLPNYVLARIWGMTVRNMNAQMANARRRGESWQDARKAYLERITEGIGDAVREQAKADAEDVTSNFLSIGGALLVKVASMIQASAKPSDVAALTRSYKTLIECHDRLTGVTAQREVYNARREENDYFVSLVEQRVQDPTVARQLAIDIQHRKALAGFHARRAYQSSIDGVYRVGHDVSEVEKAVRDVEGAEPVS